ncbi:hypothetical protein [Burkholderia latens]|uniref:hypothetical protein n=1 Tax=Burkholderia latens TaxID=488446 RepID=UPI001AE670EE|nr:hypothetical protein [Burkholderia latens]MBR7963040.1 hypothetical protein [Burkholderia vietnamiensis]QTO45698.1 hypothetical protein J8I85_25100 [Burkholderia latens]
MKANRSMKTALRKVWLCYPLSPSLKSIADSGFWLHDECYLLRALLGSTNVTPETFPDRTGYECFVNSLHVEDYDSESPLTQAILFVKEAFSVWNATQRVLQLTAIVSADEFSVVTKFHVRRPKEQWLSNNIDGYDDPIFSIDSDEDVIFQIETIR